uniref:Protein PAIR1 n=1 Tax=Oryza punctata TaxID=4537 RepID=A0A0E0K7K5_ORYPU
MKLKMNKACDIASISVLPPRRTGGSSGASASVAVAVASQPLSQQSFSQGAAASLLHSHSQFSQVSLDDNLLPSPTRDQRFGLHDDSSKRMSSLPASSASCAREESQLQLAKVPSNPMHRWNPSIADTRCQVTNEDVERKFQHLASSVNKMGMVVDSVQSDVMQLNRAMKEASLDSGSIRQKIALLESSLQQILKGQDDLKALFESSTKHNPDQTSGLNSLASKLNEISSTLATLQTQMQARQLQGDQTTVRNSNASKSNEISSTLATLQTQMQADIRQLRGDIFRLFTKEMEGVVRAIRSVNSRPSAMQMMADQSYQVPVSNGWTQINQTPVAAGRSPVNRAPVAAGRSPMNRAPVADGRSRMNQLPETKVLSAHLVYPAKVTDLKPKVEQGKVKAAPQKPFASSYCRVAPKQEEVAIRKVNPQVPAKKAPVSIIIESDDDSEGRASCVILKTETGSKEWKVTKQGTEEGLEILRRARKRRRREMQSIVLAS